MGKNYIALVLQGGGALGAYEFGVIKALYEQKDFSPDVITGVSIGAFSASVLTGAIGHPVEALAKMWELFTSEDMPFVPQAMQLMMSLSYNPGMYQPNPYAFMAPFLVTHLFDTKPLLYNTLEKVIDLDKLNHKSSPHMVITATNIETGELEQFDNRKMRITYDHIVASGSLPPSFPMTSIADQHYWDGGLFSNTPLRAAFKQIEKMGEKDSQREIILVELFPNEGKVPQNMTDVFDRMMVLSFSNKLQFDVKQYERTSGYIDLVHALDQVLPEDSDVRQHPTFQRLTGYNKVHKLSIIKNTSPIPLTAAADFTEKTITQRIKNGYADGKAFTENKSN